jgi:hypothetical protein
VAPENEKINVPTYRDTGSPLDRSTPKGTDNMAETVECCFAGIKFWVQGQVQPKEKGKNIFGAKDIAQWDSVCPACARPWVQFPNIAKSKKKKNGKEDKWH